MSRIPAPVRAALHDRARIGDIVCCEICGKPANNAHHRRNRSQGGQDVLSNLMMLDGSGTTGCHGFVTMNPAAAVRNGWTIQGPRAIASQVLVRRRGDLVFLYDDGQVVDGDDAAPPVQLEVLR